VRLYYLNIIIMAKEKIKQSETIIIKRSKIKFAAYNPRKKDAKIVEELKRNFKRVGFLGGIVWNSITGNLVGGHKRVEAMDLIFNYDGNNDYDIKVEAVEFDDKTEKEQNIFLNNKRVQGETDYELLALIIPDLNIENTGLTDYDLTIIKSLVPDVNYGNNEGIIKDNEESKKDFAQKKEEIKQLKSDIKNSIKENQLPTHFTVAFKTYDEKEEFLESIGISGDTTMITSDQFLSKLQ
jgi:hypothetical protein